MVIINYNRTDIRLQTFMFVDKRRLTIFVDHFKLLKSSMIAILGITLRKKLQRLQNRAARVLIFSDYDEDAGYLFELLGWKNPARQHEIEKATMVYKSLHRLAPEYLCSRFAIRETAYNPRDSENKLCIPLPRDPRSPFLICVNGSPTPWFSGRRASYPE